MLPEDAPTIVARIRADMRQAMKDHDRVKTTELKSLLARITNAEAVPPTTSPTDNKGAIAGAMSGVGSTEANRKQLSVAEISALIAEEMQELQQALHSVGTTSPYADELNQKIMIIGQYL